MILSPNALLPWQKGALPREAGTIDQSRTRDSKKMFTVKRYKKDDVNIPVYFFNEDAWLRVRDIARLFNCPRVFIENYIDKVTNESEDGYIETLSSLKLDLDDEGSLNEPIHEALEKIPESQRRYNLDIILPIGYQVAPEIANEFRQWATKKLDKFYTDWNEIIHSSDENFIDNLNKIFKRYMEGDDEE